MFILSCGASVIKFGDCFDANSNVRHVSNYYLPLIVIFQRSKILPKNYKLYRFLFKIFRKILPTISRWKIPYSHSNRNQYGPLRWNFILFRNFPEIFGRKIPFSHSNRNPHVTGGHLNRISFCFQLPDYIFVFEDTLHPPSSPPLHTYLNRYESQIFQKLDQ